jgi:hypothetical protein
MMGAPAIVRVPLLSAYVDGLAFCANLHGAGGFDAVNKAHLSPPASMEQVLHPELYAKGEQPIAVSIPELAELSKAGYALVDEDTLGELEMGVYLGHAHGKDFDATAAAGWGGDRVRVYEDASHQMAAVWVSEWDSERDAVEAAQAATGAADNGEVAVRAGRRLVVLRGVPEALQKQVLGELMPSGH